MPEAQLLADQPGQVDSIQVAAEPGVTPDELVTRIERVMPSTVEVKTGQQEADDEAESIQNSLSFLNILLLVFAGIAVFVGAFIIFNTFSITVAQRTKEFALLRTMGASRGQVLRSVMLEALIVGLIASILGILLGIVTAQGINALFKALGADLPQEGLVLKSRTIIVGLLVGTIVTMVASLAPARRATRVPPLAAMRDEAAVPPPPTRRRKILSWGLLIIGALAILFALFGGAPASQALSMLGVGAIALFIAVALLSPRLVPLIAGAVGCPLERLRGVAGRLARENAMRNPSRTAVTAAALMIGLALVTFVSILAAGVKASIDDTVENRHEGRARRAQHGRPVHADQPRVGGRDPAGARRGGRVRAEVLPGEGQRRRRQAVRERDRPAHVRPRVGHGHRQGTGEPVLGARARVRWRSRRTLRTRTTSTSATGWR